MKAFTPRLMYFYAFLCIVLLLTGALYLQIIKGINPCPLCILQRLDLSLLGILFFFGAVLSLKRCGYIFLGVLSVFISLLGAFLAGRQVWLQHLPLNQSEDCGVSLQYMLQVLPFDQVVKKIFTGTAECSRVDWSFLGLSTAEWTLLCFVVFAVFTLWQSMRKIR